jgi:hypothetical protein
VIVTRPSVLSRLSAPVALALFAGCAGLAPPASAPAPGERPPVGPSLEPLRASLSHPSDSLVLDLLQGYHAAAAGRADAATERRAREAARRLEALLRSGGLQEPGREARVVAPTGESLTLREAMIQLSDSLLRGAPGAAWRPETGRAREVLRRKPDLAQLAEDAEWVLVLTAELDGPRPASDKERLRRLHEAYAMRAPHSEVAAQVNALLADVREESLRRELKKLANRSWDRERRLRADPPPRSLSGSSRAESRGAEGPRQPPSLPVAPPAPTFPATDTAFPPLPPTDTVPRTDGPMSPDRFCAERRTEAARAFAAARAAGDEATRTRQLRRSLALLDDCITRHPDAPEAEKARQNRARVEQELRR